MELADGKMSWSRPPASSEHGYGRLMRFYSMRLWSFWLCALLVAAAAFGGVLMIATNMTADTFTVNFLRMGSLDAFDSWGPMRTAIEYLRQPHDASVYQQIFFNDKVKFQYPLSSLVAIDLFQQVTKLPWDTVISLLNRICWYSVWLIGFVCWRLFVHSHDRLGRTQPVTSHDLWLLWPCLGLAILFYPVSKSYALGQIQTLMTLAGALALLAWQLDRKLIAGVLIGLCCAVKPQWSVILLWAALRREWSFAAAVVSTSAVIVLAALARYGQHDFFDYLSVLSFLGERGEAFFPNQSVNGLLNRLFFNGVNLTFDIHGFPDYRPGIAIATVLSSLAILVTAIVIRRNTKPTAFDLAIILLAATMASPIAWEHHYGILLPIFALMAPACVALQPWGRSSIIVLIVAYLLAGERIDPLNRFADTPFNIVQSYLFFAALTVWALLFALAARLPDRTVRS